MSSACPDQGVESEPLSGPGSGAKLFGPHFICLNVINHMVSLSCRECWETPSLAGPVEAALDSTQLIYDVLSPGLLSQFLWNEKTSLGMWPDSMLAKQAQSPGFHLSTSYIMPTIPELGRKEARQSEVQDHCPQHRELEASLAMKDPVSKEKQKPRTNP